MNDDALKRELKQAFDAAQPHVVPPFDETYAIAADRAGRQRTRIRLGLAAALMITVTAGMLLWPALEPGVSELPGDDLLIADALMNSTTWRAPSDALLPDHAFDIYQDIPFGDVSTDLEEGSLL